MADFTEKNIDKQMSPTYSIQKKFLILPFILLVSLFDTVFLIWNNSFEMEYSNDKGRFQLMLKTHFEIHVGHSIATIILKMFNFLFQTGFIKCGQMGTERFQIR